MFPGVQPAPHWDAVKEFPSLFDGITIISRLQKCAIFQLECVWMWEEGRTDAFSWFYLSLSSSTPALFMHVRCPTLRPSNLQDGKRALCVEQSRYGINSMLPMLYASKEEMALGIGAISMYLCVSTSPVLQGRFFFVLK